MGQLIINYKKSARKNNILLAGNLLKPTLLREIQDTTTLINPILSRLIVNALPCQSNLHAKIRYALTEKGLRVRPFLVRMGYEMGGGHYRDILPIGAALELMQIATLVIDDILDESYLRNGRESIFAKWGIKKGILVGELLKTLSTVSLIHYININKKFRRKNNALMIFENAYKDICVGQYLDLLYEEKNIITEEDYLSMIEKTTASFIRASIVIGATLSCTSKNTIKSLSNYGLHLGIAYQIRDDIIDIIGESACTGKPFAGDIRRKKKIAYNSCIQYKHTIDKKKITFNI